LDGVRRRSQRPLGRSSRSTSATTTKAFDAIRKLFAGTQGAKQAGIGAGHFSFNTKGGRCENCEGTGRVTIEMQFMADVELVCDICDGKRFVPKVLGVTYKGKNISDVLNMTVDDAIAFFKGKRSVTGKLQPLVDVGLGYLRLGQATSTLSGGEMQRLKLATYLPTPGKRKKIEKHVLFIFDEPTVGLHLQDVQVLLKALRQLTEHGHSVLVVEHNIDFVAASDHVIDLGPESGDEGGQVVMAGSPAELATCERSHTGQFLAELLARD